MRRPPARPSAAPGRLNRGVRASGVHWRRADAPPPSPRRLRSCLGTSGQNVEDLYRYTDVESRGDIMEATLRWGHIAPSAPDTLCARAPRDPRACRRPRAALAARPRVLE